MPDPTTRPPEDAAFRARALAQTHPLSGAAGRYVARAVARQQAEQRLPEVSSWAGAALVDGYCLRRVEEDEEGAVPPAGDEPADLDALERAATGVAADVRTGAVGRETTVSALALLIAARADRRLELWRDEIGGASWAELEEYLTWWVVQGYALRLAEATTVGLCP
ncbi:hypothetical protein BH18ACT1_BH18ACT1_06260 [soil metagenome]